jgi:hypothetical protein
VRALRDVTAQENGFYMHISKGEVLEVMQIKTKLPQNAILVRNKDGKQGYVCTRHVDIKPYAWIPYAKWIGELVENGTALQLLDDHFDDVVYDLCIGVAHVIDDPRPFITQVVQHALFKTTKETVFREDCHSTSALRILLEMDVHCQRYLKAVLSDLEGVDQLFQNVFYQRLPPLAACMLKIVYTEVNKVFGDSQLAYLCMANLFCLRFINPGIIKQCCDVQLIREVQHVANAVNKEKGEMLHAYFSSAIDGHHAMSVLTPEDPILIKTANHLCRLNTWVSQNCPEWGWTFPPAKITIDTTSPRLLGPLAQETEWRRQFLISVAT